MADESMAALDPSELFQVGLSFTRGDTGGYGGRVEITSYDELPDVDPDLRLTVYTGRGTAQLCQSMTPDQLRELAGALERAADHADAVRRAAQVTA